MLLLQQFSLLSQCVCLINRVLRLSLDCFPIIGVTHNSPESYISGLIVK